MAFYKLPVLLVLLAAAAFAVAAAAAAAAAQDEAVISPDAAHLRAARRLHGRQLKGVSGLYKQKYFPQKDGTHQAAGAEDNEDNEDNEWHAWRKQKHAHKPVHVAAKSKPSSSSSFTSPKPKKQQPLCRPFDTRDPREKQNQHNVFGWMSAKQLQAVHDFLMTEAPELNLTQYEEATVADNYIWLIEGIPANKEEALAYLDARGPKPELHARVVVYAGAESPAIVRELKVGPLPPQQGVTKVANYFGDVYNRGADHVPFNARYVDSIEYGPMGEIIGTEFCKLANFTQSELGGVICNSDDDTLYWTDSAPRSFSGEERRTWLWLMQPGDGYFLYPVGFYFYLDHSGSDVSQWKILKFVYNGYMADTAEEFLEAWNNGSIKSTPMPAEQTFASLRVREDLPIRARENLPGPVTSTATGARFTVDQKNQLVKYMDWQFYYTVNRDTGVSLWDVRFKGKRIAYEISLQEATSQYSGDDPLQSSTHYLDRHWGIGGSLYPLLSGFECPKDGLQVEVHMFEEFAFSRPRAICIFESEHDTPLQRHIERGGEPRFSTYSTTKSYKLTVRTINAVWNYDYVFDYRFLQDGSMEAHNTASGYMQSVRYSESSDAYSTRVQEFTSGSLHNHQFLYKFDLDIYGTKNSVEDVVISVESSVSPYPPARTMLQKRIDRTYPASEQQAAYESTHHHVLAVCNRAFNNSWGYARGYRVLANHDFTNPVQGNPLAERNTLWDKYSLVFTRQHDSERWGSSTFNQNLPSEPVVDFEYYINDDESLDQQDIVVWASVGMTHVPRAEDVPVTLSTATAHSYVTISPFNYFDEAPTRDLRNTAYVEAPETPDQTLPTVDTYGIPQNPESCGTTPGYKEEPFVGYDVLIDGSYGKK